VAAVIRISFMLKSRPIDSKRKAKTEAFLFILLVNFINISRTSILLSDMTPRITIQCLGLIYKIKSRNFVKEEATPLDEDYIIEYNLSNVSDHPNPNSSIKAIFVSIITENMASKLLNKLAEDFHLTTPGKGIAFTLPINGISNVLNQLCMISDRNIPIESEVHLLADQLLARTVSRLTCSPHFTVSAHPLSVGQIH
jgi:hypothetical protein